MEELNNGARWSATKDNIFQDMDDASMKMMGNGDRIPEEFREVFETRFFDDTIQVSSRRSLPTDFIFFEDYPECDQRAPINQGQCGNCWIASPLQVLNDRFCYQMAKKGALESYYTSIYLSTQFPTSCWNDLAPYEDQDVCNGGYTSRTYGFASAVGIVSSECFGPYGPYNNGGSLSSSTGSLVSCPSACPSSPFGDDTQSWDDRHFTLADSSTDIFGTVPSAAKVEAMKQEIYDNGPISASMEVFEDFYYYSSGIYEYSSGGSEGGHAVEIVGWGNDGTDDYWIVKNSWGTTWGETHGNYRGYFRILQGVNEVGIESNILYPNLNTTIHCDFPCQNGGNCSAPNYCECVEGYEGDYCEINACVKDSHGAICSGHGFCDIGDDYCTCNSSYYGIGCEVTTCFGVYSNVTDTDLVCSGHGSCTAFDYCECEEHYYGTYCNETYCDGIEWDQYSTVCSGGHGSCVDYNTCVCNEHYYGTFCEVTTCDGVYSNISSCCSATASCVDYNECQCDEHYYGIVPYCNITTCDGILSNETGVCSDRGYCWTYDSCVCTHENYTGDICDSPKCYGKAEDAACGGTTSGTCVSVNNCSCNVWFEGIECEIDLRDDGGNDWYEQAMEILKDYWGFFAIGGGILAIVIITLLILCCGAVVSLFVLSKVKEKTKPSCSCMFSWMRTLTCGMC